MADDPIYGLSKEQHSALGRLLKTTKGGTGSIAGVSGGGRRLATEPKVPVEPRPEWLKINSNDAGGGKYDITLMTTTAKTGASGDASLPEDAVTRTAGYIAINAEETGLPTHWVKADESKYTLGRRIGVSDDDGKPIFIFDGAYYRNSSPSTIGPNSGTSTKYWHRDETASGDKFGDCPVDFYVVSRGAGASLYQRKVTFDAGGKWFMVGPEESPITLTTTNLTVTTDGPTVWTTMTNIIFPAGTTASQAGGDLTFDPFPGTVSTSGTGSALTIFRYRHTFSSADNGVETTIDAGNWLGRHIAQLSIFSREFDNTVETDGDKGRPSSNNPGDWGETIIHHKVGSDDDPGATSTVPVGQSNQHGSSIGQVYLYYTASGPPSADLRVTPSGIPGGNIRYRLDIIAFWFAGD